MRGWDRSLGSRLAPLAERIKTPVNDVIANVRTRCVQEIRNRKGHWSRKVLILPCFGEDQPFISDIHPVTLVS
ncbi:unnamed protein product [Allacma fusca]|uniref:Uncharacterized protein n=1 Tax=Allacma fusca TaxID=39272 RepID=A0A8J2PUL3_9HEXA|nr:unnamed protein product [Allacma fusca]